MRVAGRIETGNCWRFYNVSILGNLNKRPFATDCTQPKPKHDTMKKTRLTPPEEVLPMLTKALAPFVMLKPEHVTVIVGMLDRKTLSEIAKETGLTIQALHMKWQNANRQNPFWYAIRNGMMGKGVGRKKKAEAVKTAVTPPPSVEEIIAFVRLVPVERRAAVLVFVRSLTGKA